MSWFRGVVRFKEDVSVVIRSETFCRIDAGKLGVSVVGQEGIFEFFEGNSLPGPDLVCLF